MRAVCGARRDRVAARLTRACAITSPHPRC
jgi:hypothetical protein